MLLNPFKNLDQFMRKHQRKAVQGTLYKIACTLSRVSRSWKSNTAPCPLQIIKCKNLWDRMAKSNREKTMKSKVKS